MTAPPPGAETVALAAAGSAGHRPSRREAAALAPTASAPHRPAPRDRAAWLPWILWAALALGGPLLGPYAGDLATRIMIQALFALSLQWLVGVAGLVSLGHAAFFGIGAYATVLASGPEGGSIAWLLPVAVGAAASAALAIGALSLRTRGVYFIMVTLAFAQMAYFVFHDTPVGRGSDGIYLDVRPTLGPIDLQNRSTLYYAVLAALAGSYGLLALLRRSRFGHATDGIRVNVQRMRAAGFPTYRYQLASFVLAGALAGLAGFLLAARDGVVNPELLSWHVSGEVLLMVILGGIGPLRGALIGAVLFTLLKELLSAPAFVGPLADHWQLTLGIAIVGLVAALPKGVVGLLQRRSPGAGG